VNDYPNDLNKIPIMRIRLVLVLLDPHSNQLSYIGLMNEITDTTILKTTNYSGVK